MTEILQVATFLDPHFKVNYFEHLQEVKLLSIKQKVTDDALELCHELQEVQENSTRAELTNTQAVAISSLQPSAPKKRNLETLFKDHESRDENKNRLPLLVKRSSVGRLWQKK